MYTYANITSERGKTMVNFSKLMNKLEKKGITTYTIRKKSLISQGTLTKLKMCSSKQKDKADQLKEIKERLDQYKKENGKEFAYEISSKTIEDICQLLQCQPKDIMEWQVDIDPSLSYENKYCNDEE